jgi:hypothetical protein
LLKTLFEPQNLAGRGARALSLNLQKHR